MSVLAIRNCRSQESTIKSYSQKNTIIYKSALALFPLIRRQPSTPTAQAKIWRLQADPQTLADPTLQGHAIHLRFATIPFPVIKYLINDFGKIVGYLTLSSQANALVANLLTLNPPSSKSSGTCPLAKSILSRRQQSITRFARLNKQRSGDLSLFRSAPKS